MNKYREKVLLEVLRIRNLAQEEEYNPVTEPQKPTDGKVKKKKKENKNGWKS